MTTVIISSRETNADNVSLLITEHSHVVRVRVAENNPNASGILLSRCKSTSFILPYQRLIDTTPSKFPPFYSARNMLLELNTTNSRLDLII